MRSRGDFGWKKFADPVRLWHGKADRSFSFLLAEQVASRLPSCRAHFGVKTKVIIHVPIRHVREILADLKKCVNVQAARSNMCLNFAA